MKQLHRSRFHQIGGHLGGWRIRNHLPKGRNARPVAVIIEKPPGLASLHIFRAIGAGIGHVHLDAGGDLLDKTGEQPAHQHRPVAGIAVDMILCDERMHEVSGIGRRQARQSHIRAVTY